MAAGLVPATLLARSAKAMQTDRQLVFRPEAFGARGDGASNDTAAFSALAEAVNANGGGTVELRRATYIVGAQLPAIRTGSQGSFDPLKIMEFVGCRRALVIRGNGARLRCADGLRYGIFDPASGRPRKTQMPYIGPGGASPYRQMIKVEKCTGPVLIEDLELDGNVSGLVIGGQYGDTGWQIPASGIALINNRGDEIVRDVHTHHHALDGFYVDGDDSAFDPLPSRRIERVRSEYNGRQGCSIVGGRGYSFQDCAFNHTGRSAVSSAPGAGVDIEAEGGKLNRDYRFVGCRFENNSGAGMVADTGDSEGASFERCTFVGTTNWSAWPGKPNFSFKGCSFVGALVRTYGDKDARRAAQFVDCIFRDDPKLSGNAGVYRGTNSDGPLADLSDAQNVRFARCAFLATHGGTLPWSTGAIYEDCRMEQRVKVVSFPRGTFSGRTSITGSVDLYGSLVVGELTVNGRSFAAGHRF
jgi:hypothetical protein